MPEFRLHEEMAPRPGEPPRGPPRPAHPTGAPRPEGRQRSSGRESMSSPHAGATPDWALTSRASGQGQQDRWRINRQNGVVSKAAPGLGSLSGARVRQRRGRRDLGVRPGRQRRRRGCWAALSRGCGRGPTSLRLPPAPRSWARPSLAQHWGSATPTGRAPSRPRAHAPSSPLRAVVSPALVGGLPGGRSRDPSPASRRTVGASVAGA